MTHAFKFTNDGKKVAVVGQLNNTEWIVQEIFVTASGDEIPSGEKFTTKSLHEQPVETYQARQKRVMEQDITKLESTIKSKQIESRQVEEKHKALKEIFLQAEKLSKVLNNKDLEHFANVMSGSFMWVVSPTFIEEPIKFNDAISRFKGDFRRADFDSIRLVSLYGDTNGNIEYRINNYSDGSGNNKVVKFIANDKELAEHYTEMACCLINNTESYHLLQKIEIVTKYGGKISDEVFEHAFRITETHTSEQITKLEDQIVELELRDTFHKLKKFKEVSYGN